MQRSIQAGVAGLLVLALAPTAASATTVRAEGFGGTIVPETSVAATGAAVTKDGRQCAGNTAAAALDRAVVGDWDGTDFGADFGVSVDRIRTLNLPFPSATYWNFDMGNVSQPSGACTTPVTAGSEILFYEACASASTACFTGSPLGLAAPAIATAGVPFTVTVVQYDDTKDPAPSSPAGNATVSGGGQSRTTTTGAGTTSFTFDQPGTVTLVATKGRQVRDSAIVTVQAPPVYEVPTPTRHRDGGARVRHGGSRLHRESAEGRRDLQAQEGSAHAQGDRGRRDRARLCPARPLPARQGPLHRFNGVKERFVKAKCGARPRFFAGTEKQVSYLLPNKLGKGKYVFDVLSVDLSGNREAIERGRNRVVFRVR